LKWRSEFGSVCWSGGYWPADVHTLTHTLTHSHTNTNTHHTHTHTTLTHTHSLTQTQTHAHTHLHTLTHTNTYPYTLTHTPTHTLTHPHTHTLTHTNTQTHTHTHTHTQQGSTEPFSSNCECKVPIVRSAYSSFVWLAVFTVIALLCAVHVGNAPSLLLGKCRCGVGWDLSW
jgi:hypothetical protein